MHMLQVPQQNVVMPLSTTEKMCGAILPLPEAAAGGSVTVNGSTTSVAVEAVPDTSDTVVTDTTLHIR